MARLLASKGYQEVRPLLGGIEAWVEQGYPLETFRAATAPLTSLAAPRLVK